jgi:GNAT superfamily N-acetyltransferase
MNPFKTRFFRHYKNKPYRYLGIVRHSETLEEMALYETLYENKLGKMWVRPKEMFFENIVLEGQSRARFQPIQFTFKSYAQFTPELLNQFKEIYRASFDAALDENKYLSKIELHKEFHILVAYDEKRPVGVKIGYRVDQARFYSWLGAVLPEYQGLGIASEMMRLQHQWCREQGIQFIETRTRNHFRQMISLNLAYGFEIVGTLKDAKGLKILLEKDILKKDILK